MMNKKSKKTPEECAGLSSTQIRQELSLEEINHLLTEMDQALCFYKSKEQGFDPSQMVKTVRGGRVVWITIDEMNAILSKRRRLFRKQYATKESGEDRLSDRAIARLEGIAAVCKVIKKISPEQQAVFSAKRRKLEILYNHSNSLGREIRILDAAIQRKKQEDPIIREVENEKKSILDAVNSQNLDAVDFSQSHSHRHMEDYLIRQKRIQPYIHKSEECRQAYLQSKQQSLQLEYEFYEEAFLLIAEQMQEILYHLPDSGALDELVQSVQNTHETLAMGKRRYLDISEIEWDHLLTNNQSMKQFDEQVLFPVFERSMTAIHLLQQCASQWKEYHPTLPSLPDANDSFLPKAKPSSRMVYPEEPPQIK